MRLPNWVRLPGRTVRVRLTVLYALLFLFSGALLLTIASGVTVHSAAIVSGPARARPHQQPGRANARIHMLQSQVAHLQSQAVGQPTQDQLGHVLFISSLIALAIMTIVSAALGWPSPAREMSSRNSATPSTGCWRGWRARSPRSAGSSPTPPTNCGPR